MRLWAQGSYTFSSLRGNYDGGVNEGAPPVGKNFPGRKPWTSTFHQLCTTATGILALDRPHRFRFDGYWRTPWMLSRTPGEVADRGAAQQDGLLQRYLRRRPSFSTSAGLAGPPATPCGPPTSTSHTRFRSGPRDGDRAGIPRQRLQQADRHFARRGLVRSQPPTTRTDLRPNQPPRTTSTGRSPAARAPAPSAPPCASRSDYNRSRRLPTPRSVLLGSGCRVFGRGLDVAHRLQLGDELVARLAPSTAPLRGRRRAPAPGSRR